MQEFFRWGDFGTLNSLLGLHLCSSRRFFLDDQPQSRLQHLAHRVDPRPQGRVDEVGVALGGADLGVAEEASDHLDVVTA